MPFRVMLQVLDVNYIFSNAWRCYTQFGVSTPVLPEPQSSRFSILLGRQQLLPGATWGPVQKAGFQTSELEPKLRPAKLWISGIQQTQEFSVSEHVLRGGLHVHRKCAYFIETK